MAVQEFDEVEEFDSPDLSDELIRPGFEVIDVRPEGRAAVKRQQAAEMARLRGNAEDIKGLGRVANVASGIEKSQQLIPKLAASAMDLVGIDAGTEALQGFAQRNAQLDKEQEALGVRDILGRLAEGVTQAAFELPTQMIGGAGAKGAQALKRVAATQGAMGGLGSYGEDRAKGKGRAESAAYGAASGLITGLVTKAFGTTGVESILRNEGVKGVSKRLWSTLKDAGMEGLEEGADQFYQDLLERITRNPNKPVMDSVGEVLMSAGVGAILGGGVGAVTGGHEGGHGIQEFDSGQRDPTTKEGTPIPVDLEAFNRANAGGPNALQPETAQPIRNLRQEAQQGIQEVPVEGAGRTTDVGGGESSLSVAGQKEVESNDAGKSIADALGAEFKGTTSSPNRTLWRFELKTPDGKSGTAISVPAGSTVEQARAKYEAKRKEYIDAGDEANAPRPLPTESSLSVAEPLTEADELEARGYNEIRRNKMTPEQRAQAVAQPIPTLEEDAKRFWDLQDAMKSETDMAKKMALYQQFGQEAELIKNRNTKSKGNPPERPESSLSEGWTYEMKEPPARSDMDAYVKAFLAENPGAAPITVVESYHDLPDSIHQSAYRQGANPLGIKGVLHDGHIYLNRQMMESMEEIHQTILHEQAGHFATDKILGKKLNQFMQSVHDSFTDTPLMAETRILYKKADPVRLGREYVARLSENPKADPTAWNKIVAMFRDWLRSVGFVKKVTDNDIQVLLSRATKNLKTKESGGSAEDASLSIRPPSPVQPGRGEEVSAPTVEDVQVQRTAESPQVEEVAALDPATGGPVQPPAPPTAPASPKPPQGSPEFTTSNKDRVVDADRAARGLPPMAAVERQENQAAWDEARAKPEGATDALILELKGKESLDPRQYRPSNPRALTPVENAQLLQRRIDIRNNYEKALLAWRDAFQNGDTSKADEQSQIVKQHSSELADLEDVTKASGTASGRSLQARKMEAREDYSLVRMEMEAMQAKGRELTPDEHIELIKAHEKIKELQDRIAELETQKESRDVNAQTDAQVKDTAEDAKGEKNKPQDPDLEEKLRGKIKAKVAKGKINEITSDVQKLAKMLWLRGFRTRDALIPELHSILETIIPGITVNDTQRAFSGYGNFKPLSKEDVDVGLRDLRGQIQQVLKLEALEARKPLERTGQEHRQVSDEERWLRKQVNELKRRLGVVVTDPATQLKSALQSRKTYYEHRISDLKHEIETRQLIVKTKSASPTDAQLDNLIAEYERIKSEHDAIFTKPGMSDEQRLKQAIAAAQRNLAHWEVRLDNAEKGIFDRTQPGRKVTSAELEDIQAQTVAIREHVKELHDLDAGVLAQKRIEALERQKANLEKSILEQQRKLSEGDLSGPGRRQNRPADPALEALYQQRDELNRQMKEARKKPEAQKMAEQLDRINKAIDDKLAKISFGDTSTPTKRMNRPLSPELEQAKQQLEMVNKLMASLRKGPAKTKEEIALQSLKTRMASREAELRDRIARNDFSKKVRTPPKLDAEANALKAKLDIAKEEYETALEKDRWAKTSVFGKGKRKLGDLYDAARAIMTTGELSFILRQGKFQALAHPVQTAKALPATFKALVGSEERVREIENEILSDPMMEEARKDKLFIDEHANKLSRADELMMGRWVGNIPIVKNFNNAARVFLNKIRFDTWRSMKRSLAPTGDPEVDRQEGRQIATFVNEATGRGGLGKFEAAAVPLARIMFSPRYFASRLQMASGHSMWGGTKRTRKLIATEYARALIGMGLYYSLLATYFKDKDDKKKGVIETDPRSTDFGKVKIGNTRIDPLAGLSQVAVFGARTGTTAMNAITGGRTPEVKRTTGQFSRLRGPHAGTTKWSDVAKRFAQSKLHPVPGATMNILDGVDLGGDEATILNQGANMISPITYGDVWKALKEQDLEDGAAIALLAMLGEGVQTYKKK